MDVKLFFETAVWLKSRGWWVVMSDYRYCAVSKAWWCSGYSVSVGLVIERSRVRLPAVALSGNDSGQVVHTHVPLCLQAVRFGTGQRTVMLWRRTGHASQALVVYTLSSPPTGSRPPRERWAPHGPTYGGYGPNWSVVHFSFLARTLCVISKRLQIQSCLMLCIII